MIICPNCKNNLMANSTVCPNCGCQLYNQSGNNGLNKKQKGIIISLMCTAIILLGTLLAINLTNAANGKAKKTIMIYMVGSNLESDHAIATAEIAAINPNLVDLESTNILLYTGGTSKWHNFVSNKENAIYKLTENGFEKLESYSKKNMGDPKIFENFLEYGYRNYPAKDYDLILYDHGGAIQGAIYDDFTNDNLSLSDFSEALSNSPFSSDNKLEVVIFRTCLNGTLEVANIFAPYADYLVASEEVTYGDASIPMLDFLNNVEQDDDGVQIGRKFVDHYFEQLDYYDPRGTLGRTYGIIDLSKIKSVTDEFDSLVSSINLTKDYNMVSWVRSSSFQYGDDDPSYDMIDLYTFAQELQKKSTVNADKLLKAIDNAIIYTNGNMSASKGLSIYLPFNGDDDVQKMFIDVYKGLPFLSGYYSFMNKFHTIHSGNRIPAFSVMNNKLTTSNKEVTISLSDEQLKSYSSATYNVLKKSIEHPEYYELIYSSNDVTLSGNDLKTNISNNLVKIVDPDDGTERYVSINNYKNNDYSERTVLGFAEKTKLDDLENVLVKTKFYFSEKDNIPVLSSGIIESRVDLVNSTVVDFKKYGIIKIPHYEYKFLKYSENSVEVESYPEILMTVDEYDKLNFKKASLEDGEYYCYFIISDNNGNKTFSNLIKVGE